MRRIPMVSVPFPSFPILPLLVSVLATASATLRADTVVQIPVASILNTRSVTTLTEGKLVTWQIGIDGNGDADGYLTRAASLFKGDINLKALPDSGLIPATARHPDVQLNYSNADGTGNQTRYVRGIGEFTVPVPQAKYSKLFLFFTSSEGASNLTFKLTYADSSESVSIVMPDYFDIIPATNATLFNLVLDLPKWNKQNVAVEKTHHYIDGVELHPAPGKVLTEVKVSKTAAKAYLVFWGATGIATTPVALDPSLPGKAGKGIPATAHLDPSGRGIRFLVPGRNGGAGGCYSATGATAPWRPISP
jgi:hypothetical protein